MSVDVSPKFPSRAAVIQKKTLTENTVKQLPKLPKPLGDVHAASYPNFAAKLAAK